MFIDKVPASSSVELHCSVPDREPLIFNVESVLGNLTKDKRRLLYCTPVVVSGKLVNLRQCAVDAYILNRGDHRRYHFNIKETQHVKHPRQDGSLLLLESDEDSKPLNYRRATRLSCTAPGKVYFGGTVAAVDCRLKDVSSCGVAFVIPKAYKPVIGNTAQVSFSVKEFNMSYKLQSVVVRMLDVSDTEVLVGCDLTDYHPNLVALCNYLKAQKK